MQSHKFPDIIYVDIESLIKKIDECANNPENFWIKKIGANIPCGYSMSTTWTFYHIENKKILYCRKDCMKKICESLREHVKNAAVFEKKEMLRLTKEELKSYQDARVCHILWEKNLKKIFKSINYQKVRDHFCYTGKHRGAVVFVI